MRAQLEAQLKQQQLQLRLAKQAKTEHEAAAAMKVSEDKMVNAEHKKLRASNSSGAARTGINNIKLHESKLAQALMGQNILVSMKAGDKVSTSDDDSSSESGKAQILINC